MMILPSVKHFLSSLLFVIAKRASLLVDINCPELALNLAFLSIFFFWGGASCTDEC